MPRPRFALVSVLVASTIVSTAPAQTAKLPDVAVGLFAGMSGPVGTTDASFGNGYQLGGLAEFRTPLSWLGVRIDAGYQGLGSSALQATDSGGHPIASEHVSTSLFSGTASLTFRVPNLHTAVRPYATAGWGSYWLREHSVTSDDSGRLLTNATHRVNGVDTGLGLEAPLAHLVVFAEARYQNIGPAPLRFVPISLGLRSR